MPSKKSYSRFFIILQEDQKGYGVDINKTPSGYAKLEIMNDRAKASFYVQNLKRQKGPYHMILIVQGKSERELINLGQINIDEMGKADICSEYNTNNVANTNLSMDKVQGAAICRVVGDKVNSVMVGFACGEELRDWNSYPIATSERPVLKATEVKKEIEEKRVTKTEDTPIIKVEDEKKRSDVAEKKADNEGKTNEMNNKKVDLENMKADLEKERVEIDKKKAELEMERADLEKEKADYENQRNTLKLNQEKYEKDVEALKAEKNKLLIDREALNEEKDKLMKEREALENEKETIKQKESKICKYFKFIRDEDLENVDFSTIEAKDGADLEDVVLNEDVTEEDREALEAISKAIKSSQTFDEYEEEIEKYKNYRHKHGKHDKHDKNKKDFSGMEKCKTYPKEKKEEFFKDVVKDLEKVGNKENIKNCKWYKANVDKLESMYCIYDYNKYALIFYPMICYYPYIAKSKNFLVGYKYDEEENLRYIIYAIPGTKELRDQPYEGKTGFVTFMPEEDNNDKGYWLMYYDIDKNSVVVPVKKN